MANRKKKRESFLKNKVYTRNFIAVFDFLDNYDFGVFFALSKKSIKKAVTRNRIKRVFREKTRQRLTDFFKKNMSLCLISKKDIKEGMLADFNNEIDSIIEKIIKKLR